MDLTELYSTYFRIRENQVSLIKMLKIMLYAYMNGIYSSRNIEIACRRDINFMFLLEGASAPDHSTITRFRSLHFAPCSEKILGEMSNFKTVNYELSKTRKYKKQFYFIIKNSNIFFLIYNKSYR